MSSAMMRTMLGLAEAESSGQKTESSRQIRERRMERKRKPPGHISTQSYP